MTLAVSSIKKLREMKKILDDAIKAEKEKY